MNSEHSLHRHFKSFLRCKFLFLYGVSIAVLILSGSQHAYATAGQIISVVSSTGETSYAVGDCVRVNIRVQTDSLDSNSVDIILPYSTELLEPYDNALCSGSPATSAITDGLFTAYPNSGNAISNGILYVTGYDSSGTSPVNTGSAPDDALFAHLYFKVLSAQSSYTLAFDFTAGDTTDTNMTENGDGDVDVLDAVVSLTLQLSEDGEGVGGGSSSSAGSVAGDDRAAQGRTRRLSQVQVTSNTVSDTRIGVAPSTSTTGSLIPESQQTETIDAVPHPTVEEALPLIASIPYLDVSTDNWYAEGVEYFLRRNALDSTRTHFEPDKRIFRSEAAKILTIAKGSRGDVPRGFFDDVDPQAWYAHYIDNAASENWIRGYNDCYGKSRPCFAAPADALTRSQAAALILRYLGIQSATSISMEHPLFYDVPTGAWYTDVVSSAVYLCILQGDAVTGTMRPDDPVNRAEFITMFYRALEGNKSCTQYDVVVIERENWVIEEDESILQASAPIETTGPTVTMDIFNDSQCDSCGMCGAGSWNFCDAVECSRLGNCVLESGFITNSCIPDTDICSD